MGVRRGEGGEGWEGIGGGCIGEDGGGGGVEV